MSGERRKNVAHRSKFYLFTMKEAAEILRMNPKNFISQLVLTGEIKVTLINNRKMIQQQHLEEFLQEATV